MYIPTKQIRRDLMVVCALGLMCSWPVLWYGLPNLSNDGIDHARWAKAFSEQFWSGEWSPRWFMDVNGGLGSPTYFFYPPLASYAAALFWPVFGHADPYGWMLAGYSCVLAFLVSGVTSYFWLRSIAPPGHAVLGAALYMLAPYHLAINLYNRGAAAEFWVFSWLPLVLLSADGFVKRHAWAFPVLVVSYTLAVLAHPTVAACFGVVPVAYVFLMADTRRFRAGLITGLGITLGAGLAGFFLVPALLDQTKAYVALQTVGYADYRNWWLFNIRDQIAQSGAQAAGIPLALGFKARILVITVTSVFWVCLLFLVARSRVLDHLRRIVWFYLGLSLVSLFLMLEMSDVFWRAIPFLRLLQSPSRLNVMHTIACTAMFALAVPYLFRRKSGRLISAAAVVILCGWLTADAWAAAQAFSAWRPVAAERAALQKRVLETRREYPSFWPKDAPMPAVSAFPQFDRFLAQYPPRRINLETMGNGPLGVASVKTWRPRRIVLSVNTPLSCRLTLNYFFYEGWVAHVDGAVETIPLAAAQPNGFMQLQVPAGSYDLVIEFPKNRSEFLGQLISLGSALVAAVVSVTLSGTVRGGVAGKG